MAIRLLSRRDLTRAELTARLVDRGYTPSDVEPVVDRLVAGRSVDDSRTALAHVRTASRIKGRGRFRIQRELAARGIPEDIIERALTELEPGDEMANIRRFLARRHVPAKPSPVERQRAFQQLLRRGFSADAIAKALGGRDHED